MNFKSWFRWKNPSARVALDLGSHSLKWAVVSREGPRVLEYGQVHLLDERNDRREDASAQQIRRAFSRVAEQLGARSRRKIRTVVQGPATTQGYFEVPQLAHSELETAVQAESQRMVPFPPGSYELSFTRVPALHSPEKMGGFFAAARTDHLDDLRGYIEGAQLEVDNIELPALALAREFHANHPDSGGKKVALLHLGFRYTQLVAAVGPHPYFARDFTLGVRDLVHHLRVGQRCSWSTARNRIQFEDATVKGPVEPVYWRFERELQRTLAGFPFEPEAIFISGGLIPPELERRLARFLGKPVQLDPPNQLSWPDQNSGQEYKIAVGLAL